MGVRKVGGYVGLSPGEGRWEWSRQTLPFELLHGYCAEQQMDFCVLSFRAMGEDDDEKKRAQCVLQLESFTMCFITENVEPQSNQSSFF